MDSANPQFVSSGSNIYVVWQTLGNDGSNIFFAHSSDGGITFNKAIQINAGSAQSSNPSISAYGNNVYIVWNQANEAGGNEIYFSRSINNGINFEEPKNLLASSTEPMHPRVTSSQNETFVVWNQATGIQPNEVLFTQSLNNGENFEKPINVSNNEGNSLNPKIANMNGTIIIVWNDNSQNNKNDILLAMSDTGGETFENTVNLSNNTGDSINPEIYVTTSSINVAWEDSSQVNSSSHDILFTKNNGTNIGFEKPINLSNNDGESLDPTMLAIGSNVYVAWRDSSEGNNEIFLSKSVDNGANFGHPTNLSNSTGDSNGQDLGISGTNIYAVWSDDSIGNGDILFIKSNNYGDTFSKTKNLSNNQEASTIPHILLIGDKEYVLWKDETINGGQVKITDKTTSAVDFIGGFGGSGMGSFSTDQFAPQGEDQFAPQGEDQFAPQGEDQFAPQGEDQFAPQG
jgi:hypothetical protein